MKGQALVEFALVMPIFLLLVLGGGELAFFVATQFSLQRGVDLMAESAAEGISADLRTPTAETGGWRGAWNVMAHDENDIRHCGDPEPTLEFPDGQAAGSRVRVVWHCHYTTLWKDLGLDLPASLVMTGEAVIKS